MSDKDNKIRIFGSDDNLKALGELLSNETSRKIIFTLMKKEMYTNEISTALDMRVSLVIHHLKKMEELGLLDITKKTIIRKGQEHRFFKMSTDIFITLDKNKEEIKEKGLLKRIFKDGVKFAAIGVAAVSTWLYQDFSLQNADGFMSAKEPDLAISLLVIIIGLSVILIKKRKG